VFKELELRGAQGSLLWGYRAVAVVTAWSIVKAPHAWIVTARLERGDAWQCQQAAGCRELLFTAPRANGPRWCWPVKDVDLAAGQLRATLGQPLQ